VELIGRRLKDIDWLRVLIECLKGIGGVDWTSIEGRD
jgi:hypothetical protein